MKHIGTAMLLLFPFSFILFGRYIINACLNYNKEEDMPQDFDDDEDEENFIKVAIVEDKAYWIINNVLYQADVVDGEIAKEEAEPVDAFDMEFNDVNKLMNILDNMQDWKN
jgi:hypothetical protein